jgi:hypothetical protein
MAIIIVIEINVQFPARNIWKYTEVREKKPIQYVWMQKNNLQYHGSTASQHVNWCLASPHNALLILCCRNVRQGSKLRAVKDRQNLNFSTSLYWINYTFIMCLNVWISSNKNIFCKKIEFLVFLRHFFNFDQFVV